MDIAAAVAHGVTFDMSDTHTARDTAIKNTQHMWDASCVQSHDASKTHHRNDDDMHEQSVTDQRHSHKLSTRK